KGRRGAADATGPALGPRTAEMPKAAAEATRPMTAACVTARDKGWVSRRSGRCGSGNTNSPQRFTVFAMPDSPLPVGRQWQTAGPESGRAMVAAPFEAGQGTVKTRSSTGSDLKRRRPQFRQGTLLAGDGDPRHASPAAVACGKGDLHVHRFAGRQCGQRAGQERPQPIRRDAQV